MRQGCLRENLGELAIIDFVFRIKIDGLTRNITVPEPERICWMRTVLERTPEPVHALPQDARRHVSEASSDQRALLRLARVRDQSLDCDPTAYTEKQTAAAVAEALTIQAPLARIMAPFRCCNITGVDRIYVFI